MKEKPNNKIVEEFETDLADIEKSAKIPKEIIQEKFVKWLIRFTISAGLIVYFWKYNWVQKSLYVVIPLSLASLIMILGYNYFVKWRITRGGKSKRKLEEVLKKEVEE